MERQREGGRKRERSMVKGSGRWSGERNEEEEKETEMQVKIKG